jgi:hypothetical protein
MIEVEALEYRIRKLPLEELKSLRDWFHEFENELWDRKIASDFKAGKFNKLIEKARAELAQGKTREL